jgi:hypothetical protein
MIGIRQGIQDAVSRVLSRCADSWWAGEDARRPIIHSHERLAGDVAVQLGD